MRRIKNKIIPHKIKIKQKKLKKLSLGAHLPCAELLENAIQVKSPYVTLIDRLINVIFFVRKENEPYKPDKQNRTEGVSFHTIRMWKIIFVPVKYISQIQKSKATTVHVI